MSKREQCQLLGLNRSSLYYKPAGDKPEDLKLMRIVDEEYLDHPTTGVLGMVGFLRFMGIPKKDQNSSTLSPSAPCQFVLRLDWHYPK